MSRPGNRTAAAFATAGLMLTALVSPAVGATVPMISDTDLTARADTRIVGGVATKEPVSWSASLQAGRPGGGGGGMHMCGATLVSPTWLITAQHCVNPNRPTGITVRIGSLRTSQGGEVLTSKRIVVPPSKNDDIAMIELSSPSTMAPIGLAATVGPVGTKTRLYGWGQNRENADRDLLRQLDTSVRPDADCTGTTWDGIPYQPGKEICTDNPGGKAGACWGDSGGPQVKFVNNIWVLVGETSRGNQECATLPSVYPSIPAYQAWITEVSGLKPVPGT